MTPDAASDGRLRSRLLVLTAAKVVANTALRWVGPFLPTLERAFGASTSTLTTIMGAGELAGLSTSVTGRIMDRGHARSAMVAGLGAISLSSVVALAGTTASFAVAFVLLVLGIANFTVAGHLWIAHRVAYAQRGRAVGVFETSWALALLIGAPVVALLIHLFDWRGPFAATAIGTAIAAVVVALRIPPDPMSGDRPAPPDGAKERPLPRSAWPPLLASAATAAAGLSIFVVSGAFLEDRYGVSTTFLGFVAALFGALELTASVGSAAFSDRFGKRRSAAAGLVVLLVGGATVLAAGDSLVIAVAGLTVFLTGFEYSFVSSLPLVSEAAPASRGRAIGLGNSLGTLARSGGVLVSGLLYDSVGIEGSFALSAAAAFAALALVGATRVSAEHGRIGALSAPDAPSPP